MSESKDAMIKMLIEQLSTKDQDKRELEKKLVELSEQIIELKNSINNANTPTERAVPLSQLRNMLNEATGYVQKDQTKKDIDTTIDMILEYAKAEGY